jgi:hypothetical protein
MPATETATRGRGRPVGTVQDHHLEPKVTPCKLTAEAAKIARVGAGFRNCSVSEYVSRIVVVHGAAEVQRDLAAWTRGESPPPAAENGDAPPTPRAAKAATPRKAGGEGGEQ